MAIYVPLLKSKQGELHAIKELDPQVRAQIFPIFDIHDIPWNWETDTSKSTLDDHLAKLPENIHKCMGGIACAIDMSEVDASLSMQSGAHPLSWLLTTFRQLGATVIPVIGPGARYRPAYVAAAAQQLALDKRGCVVRVQNDTLADPTLPARLTALLSSLAIAPAETDLLIDVGDLTADAPGLYGLGLATLLSRLPGLATWRSLILAGASFPPSLGGMGQGLLNFPRACWLLWNAVRAQAPARVPVFGDYALDGADRSDLDVDPRVLQIPTGLRYSTTSDWLVVRGPSIKKAGFASMQGLSKQLAASSAFSGPGFSWGDDWIVACANGGPVGNPMTWRKAGVNHHVTFVTHQLSSLGGASALTGRIP